MFLPPSISPQPTADQVHRVRRQDLYDSSSERHSSPEAENEETAELRAKLNARLSNLLSLDLGTAAAAGPEPTNEPHPTAADGDGDGEAQDQGEAEFEFRLFSTSTAAAPKVVLAPDDAEARYDGPALSQRPVSHYIRGELSAEERERFRRAAVTGQDVLAWAGQRAWGLEVPWRVTKITVVAARGKGATVGGQQLQQPQGDVMDKKKKRPGKKRRIVLRKRDKAKKEAETAAAKQKMSKEEHLKEKKKRLNREKKLKRRQKEKEKKAAKGAAGGEEVAGGSGSEGSDREE
ncbi:hypothetical protein C8A01DRAFT_17170 [Parachaetomium inaequale]|uniref:Uncharacterized protein n=1 Tax=Parachaetomium inaequale TaxID=2588326 RepID=A0AAN6SQX0_9PEZI|nr:hypothetical protein C8A01DRAFT_17170 [Parachaetomium inaequale]